MDLQALLA
jgi:26S proteasome regulatory subunit N11